MLHLQHMTASQELELRDKAFYLIKKYTSYTFLDYVRGLYQQFLDGFEQQLKYPPLEILEHKYTEHMQVRHEGEYLHYLEKMAQLEEGLNNLLTTKHKQESYYTILRPDYIDWMFDRYADENGIVDDPFYILLGLGYSRNTDIFMPIEFEEHRSQINLEHRNYVRRALEAEALLVGCSKTIAVGGNNIPFCYIDKDTNRISKKWTYETLFNDLGWPIKPIYPTALPSCPSFNLNSVGQIATDEEIPVTGIYEPWLPDPLFINGQKNTYSGKVGCINYFLGGSIATDYQIEGTDRWVKVNWRLIWEDTRYLDHSIPKEEQEYVIDLKNVGTKVSQECTDKIERLGILAGHACPVSGYWFTFSRENSRQYFKQGEIFPHFESDWGDVYWQFDGDK